MSRKPNEAAAKRGGEPFLSRWARKKEEARRSPPLPANPATDPKSPAPELPPVDKLTIESDYRAFFHPKVGEDVRRAALKKLFGDPHFNVMDGLDVYIDDYSKTEPIPPEMMAGLRQAQMILASAREDTEQREREELARKRLAQEQSPMPGEASQTLAPAAEPHAPAGDARPEVPPPGAETPGKS